MPKITYISVDGDEQTVEATTGTSLMQTALDEGVDGIVGNCGGEMMCATCHVYVDEAWTEKVGPPSEDESEMLDETACPRQPNSRLSCQIKAAAELDGLVVRTPEEQY